MGTLFVVATPIGNLEDITYRAVRILGEVDTILCEDTRVTKRLLTHYNIDTPVLSYHAHSESSRSDDIIERLVGGEKMALVSDAGTPTISDPGVQLVSRIYSEYLDKIQVIAIPGPSALTTAFSISGVGGNQFIFMGYFPHKKGRETLFNEIASSARPVIFYESPHRIEKTLASLAEHLEATRRVIIARELTKIHEQVVQGTAQEVQAYFIEHPDKVRGEFVVVVDN
ncbi:MAG: 16S rRNA (cytidine(1402)-2'-O)-methyltransferase [Patescibacteria group bacterium]